MIVQLRSQGEDLNLTDEQITTAQKIILNYWDTLVLTEARRTVAESSVCLLYTMYMDTRPNWLLSDWAERVKVDIDNLQAAYTAFDKTGVRQAALLTRQSTIQVRMKDNLPTLWFRVRVPLRTALPESADVTFDDVQPCAEYIIELMDKIALFGAKHRRPLIFAAILLSTQAYIAKRDKENKPPTFHRRQWAVIEYSLGYYHVLHQVHRSIRFILYRLALKVSWKARSLRSSSDILFDLDSLLKIELARYSTVSDVQSDTTVKIASDYLVGVLEQADKRTQDIRAAHETMASDGDYMQLEPSARMIYFLLAKNIHEMDILHLSPKRIVEAVNVLYLREQSDDELEKVDGS